MKEGTKHSEESKRKMSTSQKGKKMSEEHKSKMIESLTGRIRSKESREKQSATRMGFKHSEETKRKMSESHKGKKRTIEQNIKQSATLQCVPVDEWIGFISYEPYCHRFNDRKKEEIRNQYMRTCIISGKSAFQNRKRLSVHHVDNNKQQGCVGIPWKLIPLTSSWHRRLKKTEKNLLLNLLLINNPKAEINYGS